MKHLKNFKEKKLETIINKIHKVLSDDILSKKWRLIKSKEDDKTFGHCYAASEALYYLLGGDKSGLKPQVGKDDNGNTHWWLKDSNNIIIDPTANQFYSKGIEPPYKNGKGCGFLTNFPSKRAKEIIRRVEQL